MTFLDDDSVTVLNDTHLELRAKRRGWILLYLPDLKTWVEVKGRIEPRDDYLLKEIADLLKRNRQEQLFVYTQSKAYAISIREFKEITHKDLWELLECPM